MNMGFATTGSAGATRGRRRGCTRPGWWRGSERKRSLSPISSTRGRGGEILGVSHAGSSPPPSAPRRGAWPQPCIWQSMYLAEHVVYRRYDWEILDRVMTLPPKRREDAPRDVKPS